MAKKQERAFAFVAAILFFFSAVAFSAAVVWQIHKDSQQAETQKAAEKAAQTAKDASEKCKIAPVDGGKAEALPEVYKPEGDVTQLETKDLKVGTGKEAKSGDCLQVKYHGTLAKDGTFFDGNFDKASVLQFPLGAGSVIEGWDKGVVGMKEGGVRRLVIPSELAYKDQAAGSIPANSDLVFVVELVKIQQ